MADTFSNDLRLRLQESGSNAGTWGDLLNGTITNIASGFGQGSEAIPNASTHTITLADGTADEARSLYLKCTGGGQACTVTLGPNTISKVWIIDNATSYTLTFSQGSGANVAIAAGAVKVIATDGAGSGAAVVDTLDGLEGSLSTLAVTGVLTTTAATVFNGGFAANAASTITTADNLDTLSLISTDADASAGPNLRMYRNSASPADADVLGVLEFEGRNDNSQDVIYGAIKAQATDVSDGSEDSTILINSISAGALRRRITFTPTEAIINDDGVDLDFRVESDTNTHALFVDGGNNHVNVGTATDLGALFNVGGTSNFNGSLVVDPNTAGKTTFSLSTNAVNDARLQMKSDTTVAVDIQANGNSYFNGGKVGIGETSPAATLHLDSTGVTAIAFDSNAGTQQYEMGTGYSGVGSANNFYLYNNTSNSASLIVDASGNVTKPSQPAFSAKPANNDQTNIAVSTLVTVLLGTEVFDVGANFASNTFTAPVTGKYQLNTEIRLDNIDTAANYYHLYLTTSNRIYHSIVDPGGLASDPVYWSLGLSTLADMDAGDSASVAVYQAGGTAQTDINGDAGQTFFTGHLAC